MKRKTTTTFYKNKTNQKLYQSGKIIRLYLTNQLHVGFWFRPETRSHEASKVSTFLWDSIRLVLTIKEMYSHKQFMEESSTIAYYEHGNMRVRRNLFRCSRCLLFSSGSFFHKWKVGLPPPQKNNYGIMHNNKNVICLKAIHPLRYVWSYMFIIE